jgi:two-component system, OmpR family, response regulator
MVMEKTEHILVVDDDVDIRELLSQFLQKHNFKVSTARDGREMNVALKRQHIDLIVLDVMLPGKTGTQLCQEVRQYSQIPILMLTAVTEEVDRIIGLEMGADDYIAKPFNPRELLARIKAVLRRTQGVVKLAPKIDKQPHYHFADWVMDPVKRSLTFKDGMEVVLSSGEYDLLLAFLERPQQVMSRDLLLDITKNREAGPYDRSIDIQISRLRHKIEDNPKKPELIKTVRGGGYVLTSGVSRR